MNNKVLIKNPNRSKFTSAVVIAVIYTLCFLTLFLVMNYAENQNYNGYYRKFSGTVEKAAQNSDSDVWFLYLEGDSEKYCTTPVEGALDWQTLVGKQVEIFVPKNQVLVDPPLVLGLNVDGKTVINPDETTAKMRADKTDVKILFALTIVCAAITCALVIWKIYTPKGKEVPLAEAYAKWSMFWLPQIKYHVAINIIVVIVATVAVSIVFDSIFESDATLLWLLGVIIVAVVASVCVGLFMRKKSDRFYAENYPFDFNDISHIKMPKKARLSAEKDLADFTARYPHTFAEGGNGYFARFEKDGITLLDREEIYPEDYGLNSTDENIFEGDVPHKDENAHIKLSYEQLNLEALAFFRYAPFKPLTIVVKSRLYNVDLSQGLASDLHFVFDKNLLATFRAFDVPVENLEYILNNKAALIAEHRKKSVFPHNLEGK